VDPETPSRVGGWHRAGAFYGGFHPSKPDKTPEDMMKRGHDDMGQVMLRWTCAVRDPAPSNLMSNRRGRRVGGIGK